MADDLQFEISFCEGILRRLPGDVITMEMLAGLYTRAGRVEEGLRLDQKIVQLEPGNPVGHYNLACSHALMDSPQEALAALRKALESGYNDVRWMLEDPDLEELRNFPGFNDLLSEFKMLN